MSTLSEHTGNGNPRETSLQREDTKEQIYEILQHFDVLPSRFDRVIFKYIYVYLIGLFIPSELLLILFILSVSPQLQAQVGGVPLGGGLNVLSLVAFISIIWTFNVWRSRTPKTLLDLLNRYSTRHLYRTSCWTSKCACNASCCGRGPAQYISIFGGNVLYRYSELDTVHLGLVHQETGANIRT